MLGLCKCCLGYSSLEEKKYGGKDPAKTESPEILDLKAPLVMPEPMIIVDEPTKHSSFAEDDSGACCHDEASKSMSREISGENITISSSLIEESDLIDRVQLTVSSVNTVLEDLPETEDEHDYEEDKLTKEISPLLPQIKLDDKASVGKDKVDNVIIVPASRMTFRVIRANRQHPALKVDGTVDTIISTSQTSLSKTGTQSSNSVVLASRASQLRQVTNFPLSNGVTLSGSKSATSSRHNSGDSATKLASVLKNRHCVSVTNTSAGATATNVSTTTTTTPTATLNVVRDRERSPCVSFGTDVVYVETIQPDQRRPRSRSDASSRFRSSSVVDWHKSKIAWLRERREQRRKEGKEGSEKSLVSKKDSKEEDNLAASACPATSELLNGTSADSEVAPEAVVGQEAEGNCPAELPYDIPPAPRARARSEKFFRPSKKEVLGEVSKKTPFDWPLGRLGKLRQKYSKKDESGSTTPPKPNYTVRSMSVAALTKHEAARYSSRLKRNNSEKQKDKKLRVAFDKSNSSGGNAAGASNWLSKLFFDKSKQTKKRRRHPTDPDARESIK